MVDARIAGGGRFGPVAILEIVVARVHGFDACPRSPISHEHDSISPRGGGGGARERKDTTLSVESIIAVVDSPLSLIDSLPVIYL